LAQKCARAVRYRSLAVEAQRRNGGDATTSERSSTALGFDRNRFLAPDQTGGGPSHELAPVGELA